MSVDQVRKEDEEYGLKIEKPLRKDRWSSVDSVRVMLLIISILVSAVLVQQAIYHESAKRYETAVSVLSASAENAASLRFVQEELANAPININTADMKTLCELQGIGETKAQAIIDYRLNNGLFTYKEELMKVSGIGEKLYAQIADRIILNDEELTTE